MKLLKLRCPKCKSLLSQTDTEQVCTTCNFSRPRFIKPDTTNPLFLSVKTKRPEDKKFLEDIMFPPKKEFKDIHEDGTIFIRNEYGKITGVTSMFDLCKKLAKEIRGEKD